MALRKPLVIVSGQIQQLQPGDTLDASASEVDVVQKTNGNAAPIVICTPVYVKADATVDKTKADASGTIQLLGMVKDVSIDAATAGSIQTDGVLAATHRPVGCCGRDDRRPYGRGRSITWMPPRPARSPPPRQQPPANSWFALAWL